MTHQYSERGIALTKSFESCKLTPYKDIVGVWTDGWGNTINVVPGHVITQEEADARLLKHIQNFSDAANHYITVPVTQNQFDACVDLMFNIGVTAFAGSTLLRLLNQGLYNDAAQQFPRWNKAGGKEVAGLTRRRLAEQKLFLE